MSPKINMGGGMENKRIDIPSFADLTISDYYDEGGFSREISEAEDLSHVPKEVLESAEFDTTFPWPEKLPEGFDPKELIEKSKNPSLGIRKLHEEGITGKGIIVAIIDQKISPDHTEFKENIISHKEYNKQESDISMHGPGVVSLLAGKTCGVAPGVKIMYRADLSPGKDYSCYIKSLEDVIEYNKNNKEKIKIVSVSKGHLDEPLLKEWIEIKEKAKKLGITVIDSQYFIINNITGGGSKTNKDQFDDYDLPLFYNDKESDSEPLSVEDVKNKLALKDENFRKEFFNKYKSIENFVKLKKEEKEKPQDDLIVPCDYRTMASRKGDKEYVYNAKGGWSWAIPYFAGVFALALQVKPDLTNEKFLEIVRKTAGITKKGLKVINPPGIIEEVKKIKKKKIKP